MRPTSLLRTAAAALVLAFSSAFPLRAQTVRTAVATVAGAVSVVPVVPTLNAASSAKGSLATLTLQTAPLPSILPSVGAAPTLALPLPSAKIATAQTGVVAAAAEVPSKAAPAQAVRAKGTLETGAQEISASRERGGEGAVLEKLFSASSMRAGVVDAGASASLRELEASAVDSSLPLPRRLAAVAAAAKVPGGEAKAALRRIAEANPQGGAADYEVHRAALAELAGMGLVMSLRPVSAAHAKEILAGLSARKPKLAVFDYDDTLAPWLQPISRAQAAALQAAGEAGTAVAILTDRPERPEGHIQVGILDSIEGMTPQQKARLVVMARRGLRGLRFDAKGEPVLVHEEKVSWTGAEKDALRSAGKAVAARYGSGKEDLEESGYQRYLRPGTSKADLEAAARLLQDELARRAMDYEVVGRMPKNPRNPPFLTLTKADKSMGIRLLRTRADLRGAPAGEDEVPAESMVVVGDQFFDDRVTDRNMSKGAPGVLALAVGGTADPRVPNVFVWSRKGEAASREILSAIAR
ncbi:MAG: hypothetical protein WC969_03520 [Elusimicrobiota bacterium]